MPPKVDVELINPFIEATLECLAQMAGLNPQRKKLFIKQDPKMYGDLSGIIGMSNGITGSCSVSFQLPLAQKIVEALLGDPCDGNEELIMDGIGEVANMVAGGAKRRFQSTPYSFDISTPTVIMGKECPEIYDPSGSICIACEFQASTDWDDLFAIEVAVKPPND